MFYLVPLKAYKGSICSNFNTREFDSRELVQFFSTLLETVVFIFDHLCTQDSPICPLNFEYKTGHYVDQGG